MIDGKPDAHHNRTLEDLREAAIQAEFETGVHETTVDAAKAHVLLRLARITLGALVTLLGIVALPLPGPGWLIIAGGLAILSRDVEWAGRLLLYIRKRVPGVPDDGKIPAATMVRLGLITAAFIALSLYWTFGGGKEAAGDLWNILRS
ncbi:MAG: hypothetical protein O3C27_08205 [Actinomycetota bacterium]|nr:hypothetical protein [Actinomycetota bacterium]